MISCLEYPESVADLVAGTAWLFYEDGQALPANLLALGVSPRNMAPLEQVLLYNITSRVLEL